MYLTRYRTMDSPIGRLTLAGQESCLTNLAMEGAAHPPSECSQWVEDTAAFPDVVAQIATYFAGVRTHRLRCRPLSRWRELPATDVRRPVQDPLRGDPLLRRDRSMHWPTGGGPGRRAGQRT